MKSSHKSLLIAVGAASTLLLAPASRAWVAVRGGYRGGCVGCGVAVGVAAGAVTGAAIAHAATPTTTTVVVPPPAPNVVTTLPSGCRTVAGSSGPVYQCGSSWYQPYFGGSSVYYQPVPPP